MQIFLMVNKLELLDVDFKGTRRCSEFKNEGNRMLSVNSLDDYIHHGQKAQKLFQG